MINDYFYNLAQSAVESAASKGITNIDPKWVYSQWVHESDNFTSQLALENRNLGGLTQTTPNDSPQPDGSFWYIIFDSYEDYADYFGKYLRYFTDSGIDQATTMIEYIEALKNSPSGAYFGDSLENYIAGCEYRYNEAFGDD